MSTMTDETAELLRAAEIVQRARLAGRATPAGAALISSLASSQVHDAAIELQKRTPGLSYRKAVEAVSRVKP